VSFFILISREKSAYRKFIIITLIISLTMINIVAGINYYIDPLRMYSHNHENNSKQLDFNERQQKTNYLKYVNNDFDAIARLDIAYIDSWSIWLDIKILLQTIKVVFSRKGSY